MFDLIYIETNILQGAQNNENRFKSSLHRLPFCLLRASTNVVGEGN